MLLHAIQINLIQNFIKIKHVPNARSLGASLPYTE